MHTEHSGGQTHLRTPSLFIQLRAPRPARRRLAYRMQERDAARRVWLVWVCPRIEQEGHRMPRA